MESLANTKRSLQEARSLVDRGRALVDSTLNGLEKVNKEIKVGVDISKFLNKKNSENDIKINEACFHDSLENAERSLVKFTVDANVDGKSRVYNVESALDGNLEPNLAEGLANHIYPGYFDFNKKLEQVKLLLSNLDGQKRAIARDIDDVTNGRTETVQQKRYRILPRFLITTYSVRLSRSMQYFLLLLTKRSILNSKSEVSMFCEFNVS